MADSKINYLRGLARLYSLGYIHHDACHAFAREDHEPVACSDGLIHHPNCKNMRVNALDEVLPWREIGWHPETWRMAIKHGGRPGPRPNTASSASPTSDADAKLAKARALLDGYGHGEGPTVSLLVLLGEVKKVLGDGPVAEVEFADVYRRAKLEAFVKKVAALDEAADNNLAEALTSWDVADVYKALRETIEEARDLLTSKTPTREEIWAKQKDGVRQAYAKALGLSPDASISEIYGGLLGIFTKPRETQAAPKEEIHELLRGVPEHLDADHLSELGFLQHLLESAGGHPADSWKPGANVNRLRGELLNWCTKPRPLSEKEIEAGRAAAKRLDERAKDAGPATTHAWLYVSGVVACQNCGAIRMEPETRVCPGGERDAPSTEEVRK